MRITKIFKNIKAQMTIFVILGFIILIIFMLLSAVANGIKEQQLKTEGQKVLKSFIEKSTINQYITSCVDVVAKDAVKKVALQGGAIYDYQTNNHGFVVNTSNFEEGKDYIEIKPSKINISYNPQNDSDELVNISYGMKISGNTGEYPYLEQSTFSPPEYPLNGFSLNNNNAFSGLLTFIVQMYEGYFGEYSFAALCESSAKCKTNSASYFSKSNHSIEAELQSYIEVKVKECVNFSYFEEQTAYTITEGNVSAEIDFTSDQVITSIDYPVTISYQNQEPITESLKFQNTQNIRLTKIYELIHTILKRESYDAYFDVLNFEDILGMSPTPCILTSTLYDGSSCYDNQIEVSKINNICDNPEVCDLTNIGEFDDLVVIVDNSSRIDGVPLMFTFLIQNRRPVLDLIKPHPGEIDIVVFENQTIYIDPEGVDPDGTGVWYEYSGWKEDYNVIFDKQAWQTNPPNNPSTFNFEDYPSQYFTIINNPDPHNWTLSNKYVLTGQNATYGTIPGDLGIHKINVTIRDEEGLKDWQEITIFVRDLPQAIANASNNYTDIPDTDASVEDPYVLDARYSFVVIGGDEDVYHYKWTEPVEPINIEVEVPVITLPYPLTLGVDYDISDITNFVFQKIALGGAVTRDTSVALSAGIQLPDGNIYFGDPDYFDITIHQCLPHSADTEPYPYAGSLIFQADHTCCSDGSDGKAYGEYQDSFYPCFEKTEYATLQYFTDNYDDWWTGYLPSSNSGDLNSIVPSITSTNDNDIFVREFERSCSGTRGNICNGTADSEVTTQYYAPDVMVYGANQRCYGPPLSFFPAGTKVTTSDPGTYQIYQPGTTFEEKLNDPYGSDYTPCRSVEACYSGSNIYQSSGKSASAIYNAPTAGISNLYKCDFAYCRNDGEDLTTGNCHWVLGSECYCSQQCGADGGCEGEDPGQSSTNNAQGCTLNCDFIDCTITNPGYAFDETNFDCYDNCNAPNGNSKCAPNYYCDYSPSPNDECIQCNGPLQVGGTEGEGACERACSYNSPVHLYCDEVFPGEVSTNGAGICNANCQIDSCETINSWYDYNLPTGSPPECSCLSGGDCSSGSYCDDDGIGECVTCNSNNVQTFGTAGNNLCEQECGASIECDEITPGVELDPINEIGCNNNCQYLNCGISGMQFVNGECTGSPN